MVYIARILALHAKEKELRALETQINKERQFNRKVELNAILRSIHTKLAELAKA